MSDDLNDVLDWRVGPAVRRDVVTIPLIWLLLGVSVLFHAAMLWFLLPLPEPHPGEEPDPGKAAGVKLVTRLTAPPKPPAALPPPPSAPAPAEATPSPPPPSRAPRVARTRPPVAPVVPPVARPPTPTPAPPVIAAEKPAPEPLPKPPPVEPAPAPPPPDTPQVAASPPGPAPAMDFSTYIEAKRRARGGGPPSPSSADAETDRRNRIVAANLGTQQTPFGYDPKSGGGLFQMKRIGSDDAEFYFMGWNKDIERRAKQVIEVRKGPNEDIQIAVVRKMIAIIRDEVKTDFNWQSARLGRWVSLSARPADNAALEQFLLEDFFPDPRSRR